MYMYMYCTCASSSNLHVHVHLELEQSNTLSHSFSPYLLSLAAPDLPLSVSLPAPKACMCTNPDERQIDP